MKITAKIEKDFEGEGYWLIIDHEDNELENTAMAITEEEIQPILKACMEYVFPDKNKPYKTVKYGLEKPDREKRDETIDLDDLPY